MRPAHTHKAGACALWLKLRDCNNVHQLLQKYLFASQVESSEQTFQINIKTRLNITDPVRIVLSSNWEFETNKTYSIYVKRRYQPLTYNIGHSQWGDPSHKYFMWFLLGLRLVLFCFYFISCGFYLMLSRFHVELFDYTWLCLIMLFLCDLFDFYLIFI